jgi:hypothetical protein
MAHDGQESTGFSLRRWSRRKLAAARSGDTPHADNTQAVDAPASVRAAPDRPPAPAAPVVESRHAAARPVAGATTPRADGQALAVALPPLESLTIDSDFSPFMQAGVDEGVRRSALRKLLRHPQFNVMDGLDTYIDDYSKPSPLEPELARTLMQARYIFNPPKTRVNADGHVEDVPDEPASADADVLAADASGPPVADAVEAGSGGDATSGSALQVSARDDVTSRSALLVSAPDDVTSGSALQVSTRDIRSHDADVPSPGDCSAEPGVTHDSSNPVAQTKS